VRTSSTPARFVKVVVVCAVVLFFAGVVVVCCVLLLLLLLLCVRFLRNSGGEFVVDYDRYLFGMVTTSHKLLSFAVPLSSFPILIHLHTRNAVSVAQ
jgi:hypothetical protein